jgi:hypothetical protein
MLRSQEQRVCDPESKLGQRRARAEAKRLRARCYQCPHCYAWHLTSINRDETERAHRRIRNS